MKKVLSFLLIIISVIFTSTNASAVVSTPKLYEQRSIEYINSDLYVETVITGETNHNTYISTFATNKTITRTKTNYYKNNSGKVLWTVSVTGTFTYNGVTSKCISCSHSTTSPGAYWTIKSSTSYKAANYATASATATYTGNTGAAKDYSRTVMLQCDEDGNVS